MPRPGHGITFGELMLAALLMLADGAADIQLKSPPLEWVQEHSTRYGFDVTPDGNLWINVDPPRVGEDYAILANDLYKASGRWRTVWVRGYFKHAPKVPIRESKMQISVDCEGRRLATLYRITYAPDGSVVDNSSGGVTYTPAIPGTYGEQWVDTICAIKAPVP